MTEQATDENFVLQHVHRASAELLFACMTDPVHLSRFWGPVGTSTPPQNIHIDLRPGGAFETTMVNDATGEAHRMRAVYVAVDRPTVLSWRELDSGVVTELTFDDLGDGRTQVTTRQRGLPPQWRTPQARAGWQSALDRFAAYVAGAGDDHDEHDEHDDHDDHDEHHSPAGGRMTIEATRVMDLVGRQFRSLADELERQGEAIACQQSSCTGWTVAHVVAHVTMAARYDGAAFGKELEAAGFDFGALSNAIAERDARLPFPQLLADLRSDTMSSWIPPGGDAVGALSHIVIHSLDITVPNALDRTVDDAAITVVLRAMTEGDLAERFGRTAEGHEIVATDLEFAFGHGPRVRASAADLVLALANRPRPGVHLPLA